MSASNIQANSRVTNSPDAQVGRIDEMDSKAELKRGRLPERHARSIVKTNPTAHHRFYLSCSNKRMAYWPWSEYNTRQHTSIPAMSPLHDPRINRGDSSAIIKIWNHQRGPIFAQSCATSRI